MIPVDRPLKRWYTDQKKFRTIATSRYQNIIILSEAQDTLNAD